MLSRFDSDIFLRHFYYFIKFDSLINKNSYKLKIIFIINFLNQLFQIDFLDQILITTFIENQTE